MDCKSRTLSAMDDCIDDCEPFNESCDADCFIDYHNSIKVRYHLKQINTPILNDSYYSHTHILLIIFKSCPCMDYCQSGCPCEDDHYNCTSYTTTKLQTFTEVTLTTAPTDDYIDDLTAGKIVTIGNF